MARPLRVLVLSPDFPPAFGGIQVAMHRIASHLPSSRVEVVTFDWPGAETFDESETLDVRRVRMHKSRKRSVAMLNLAAINAARESRPDVVLSGHIVTSPAASLLSRIRSIPFVQYVYADEVRSRPRLAAFAVRHADAVVAISRHSRNMAHLAAGRAEKVQIIPVGVDLPLDSGEQRAERPTILTVARLRDRHKGHDVIIRAMPLILERVPDAQWVVLGDGRLRGELEQLAASHGLNGHARFLGQVSDAERDAWLDRAHLFAMPSRLPDEGVGGEGFGIVYLEAGAHGLPVVAGNVAGAMDAVVDGETGFLVDPTDHVAVADAVADILGDPAKAEELGRAGAARAREFAWPVIGERLEQLLLEVAHRNGNGNGR